MSVFFFGMGYSSRAAARWIRHLSGQNVEIHGTSRTLPPETGETDGICWHLFAGTRPEPGLSTALTGAQHVVHSIAPDEDGDAVLAHQLADLDRTEGLEWLCYYSTVGVYGNFNGEWVTEDAPCQPVNKRSQWRVRVEEQWRRYADRRGLPLLILRLAGIYGPGRSAFDKLASGKARRIIKPGQVFNRIHVEDIGRVTALALQQKLSGTFNLADDEPAPPQDLVSYAAELAGVPPPPEVPFEDADMTPMARSFYADNKRVSNAKIKKALGIDLIYPTYRDGLTAIANGTS